MIEVNGMAHVILTVSQWEKARTFYAELLPFLGMTKVYDGKNFLYHVGGRTAIGIQRCAQEYQSARFVQNRVGLHHLCLRARSREDVDAAAALPELNQTRQFCLQRGVSLFIVVVTPDNELKHLRAEDKVPVAALYSFSVSSAAF